VIAWRVVKNRYVESAFDGEGARLFGGRWHSAGRGVVYASATASLALLETLVHADLKMLPFYVTIPITFDAAMVETVNQRKLPPSWRSYPAPYDLQRIGDEWVESQRSCILEIPSVIVPHESNFIVNPRHPGFHGIAIGSPVRLDIDPRMR
jgi:RES domain-containing protein